MAENDATVSKYQLRRVDNISPKPIQSLGTYVSLDAECVVAGSTDKNLRFMDPDDLEELAKCTVNKKSVSCVAISDMSLEGDDPVIVTGGKDSFVQIWNPTEGNLEKNVELPTNEVRSLAIYQGSETFVVAGTKDSKVILWNIGKNTLERIFEGHRASIHSVSISSSIMNIEKGNDMDFLCLASGGADRTARTWDVQTGKKKKKFRHARSISTMVVANKGIRPILATAGVERIIRLWDVDSGVLLRSLDGHLDQINTLALWEGHQMLIVSGSADHTIRIYDILSGECVCIFVGHDESVLGVTIANYDDPKIVSCSDDLSLIQWNLKGVLEDFFHTSEDQLGVRNEVPPYLPDIRYEAPQELDRSQLSKEERKRIRKEQKKEKRLKNTLKYGGKKKQQQREEEEEEDEEEEEEEENEAEENKEDDSRVAEGVEKLSLIPVAAEDSSKGGVNSSARRASVGMMNGIMSALGVKTNSVGIEPPSPAGATPTTAGTTTGTGSRQPATEKKEEKNLRLLANEAQTKFSQAQVEKQLLEEKEKSNAASKLAERLKKKKLEKQQQQKQSQGEEEASQTVGVKEEEEGGKGNTSARTAEEEEAEIHRLKVEKLRQHQAQEKRRQQSMFIAKNRSANALQKRLEDLAAKRKASGAVGGGRMEGISAADGDSDEEEDDSDDDDNSN